LKSPGTVKISVMPTSTSRRARWLPRVDSDEARDWVEGDFWIVETVPFDEGVVIMSLHGGLHVSRDPRFVSILKKMRERKFFDVFEVLKSV